MSEPKFTPGSWIFEPGESGDSSVGLGPTPPSVTSQIGDLDVPICTLDDPCVRADREPTDEFDECVDYHGTVGGNGDLIAASPRMYEFILKRAEAGDAEAAEIVRDINPINETPNRR